MLAHLVLPRGDALEPCQEHGGDRLVPVDVHREHRRVGIHGIADRQHFGALLCAGFGPFAIQVGARGIGAKVAAPRTVGIAVRHDMKAAAAAQFARDRIGGVGQPFQRAFHPPFGHRFARMLARIKPHARLAFAQIEAVERLPVQRGADLACGHALAFRRQRHQIVMPFHRIGGEIGEPRDIAGRGVADGQRAAILVLVERAGGAHPIVAIFGNARVIVGPAGGIGAVVEAGNPQRQVAPRRARDTEMEPLLEFVARVVGDGKRRACAVDGQNFDVAAVEGGIDGNIVHGQSASTS